MKKINVELAKVWVDALRSGDFNQTDGRLGRVDNEGNESFCCLGVLCELVAADGTISRSVSDKYWDEDDYHEIQFEGASGMPGESVIKTFFGEDASFDSPRLWEVDLPESLVDKYGSEQQTIGLSDLNDSDHLSFDQIADAIENSYIKVKVSA